MTFMPPIQFRAEFDAAVVFSNGGGLQTEGFRIDVPGPDTSEREVAELFIRSLNLLMVDRVDVRELRLFPEAHKGTHGGPSDGTGPSASEVSTRTWVDLSHVIVAGMTTYPGLPAPEIVPHLTREDSREVYAPGTEFAIDRISMVGNTGTYLDSPYHRYADGGDLASLPLATLADLPAVIFEPPAASRGRSTWERFSPEMLLTARCSCTPVAIVIGAPPSTPRMLLISPKMAPTGWSNIVHGWSGSTRSTSTTRRVAGIDRLTASCSPPGFRLLNTSPVLTNFRRPGLDSRPYLRASLTSEPSLSGPTRLFRPAAKNLFRSDRGADANYLTSQRWMTTTVSTAQRIRSPYNHNVECAWSVNSFDSFEFNVRRC
jgi:hypothetical protein